MRVKALGALSLIPRWAYRRAVVRHWSVVPAARVRVLVGTTSNTDNASNFKITHYESGRYDQREQGANSANTGSANNTAAVGRPGGGLVIPVSTAFASGTGGGGGNGGGTTATSAIGGGSTETTSAAGVQGTGIATDASGAHASGIGTGFDISGGFGTGAGAGAGFGIGGNLQVSAIIPTGDPMRMYRRRPHLIEAVS